MAFRTRAHHFTSEGLQRQRDIERRVSRDDPLVTAREHVDRLCTFADGELCRFDARRAAADNDDFFALELGFVELTRVDDLPGKVVLAFDVDHFGSAAGAEGAHDGVKDALLAVVDDPAPVSALARVGRRVGVALDFCDAVPEPSPFLEFILFPHAFDLLDDLVALGEPVLPGDARVEAVQDRVELQLRRRVFASPDAADMLLSLEERNFKAVVDEVGGAGDTGQARADDGDVTVRLGVQVWTAGL
jgi:hypothetical protein